MTMVFFILVEMTTPLLELVTEAEWRRLGRALGLGGRSRLLLINRNKRKLARERGRRRPSQGRTLSKHLLEDSATDADVASEGALVFDVAALNGGLGGLEACTV